MTKYQFFAIRHWFISLSSWVFLLFFPLFCLAQAVPTDAAPDNETAIDTASVASTLDILASFANVRNGLLKDIKVIKKRIDAEKSETEKNNLKQELVKLQLNLKTTTRNMDNVITSIDISYLEKNKDKEFSFQKEFFALLKPALEEMKEMTSHVRKKSDLREKIEYYEERLPLIEEALSNIARLLKYSKNKSLTKELQKTAKIWHKKQAFMQSELQAAQFQLEELIAEETSITDASQIYIKSFFKKRGLYLTQALLAIILILLISQMTFKAMQRYLPGFKKKKRSFRIRLIELAYRLLTIIILILAPMIVFYIAEDWVLFSLGILLIIGIALTLRHTLPLYWHQGQLFLNIGSVREGERIFNNGLPWEVQRINFYCTLFNPVAEISQRLPLTGLVGLTSRPSRTNEPWFPCKRNDWVLLNDGVRGKVIGISMEMVQLVERGGATVTYLTSDFLDHSPRNLSTNFRLKESLGISYSLQKKSTKEIPETLHRYIQQRAEQEGYGEQLLNLRVEFAQAGDSSLDLIVIADFKGELGDLYNRLRRAIQRWCVDACSEYGWEIPFPQMTLHGELAKVEYSGSK